MSATCKLILPVEVTSAMLTSSTILEDDAAEWSAGTTYALDDLVILASTHRIYRSLVGSNLANNPATDDGTNWLDSGATMRWRLFDTVVGAQSAADGGFSVVIQIDSDTLINSIAAFNVIASSIRIVVTDPIDGVVYDVTTELASTSEIDDWYDWFYKPLKLTTNFAVTDIPAYVGAAVTVYFIGTGIVSCGELVLGTVEEIGTTGAGARPGVRDYSVKEQDVFGNYDITARTNSKRANLEVLVAANQIDTVFTLVTELLATKVVLIGSDTYGCLIIYGFPAAFEPSIDFEDATLMSFEFEGLT